MTLKSYVNVSNALDGSSRALGRTIFVEHDTTPYKVSEGTLTTNTVIDVYTDLGRFGTAGYLVNDDDVSSVGVQFSVDGTNYGDEITVKAQEILDFNVFFAFKTIRLVHTNNIPFRMVVR